MSLDFDEIRNVIANLTQEERDYYFPKDETPKGWVDIHEHLPMVTGQDFIDNDALVKFVKVKDKHCKEYMSQVGDHNMWKYLAIDTGITHWWNE